MPSASTTPTPLTPGAVVRQIPLPSVGNRSMSSAPGDADAALVAQLRAGDEGAYTELVGQYSRSMLRVALRYARSHAVAEEAVQETWLAVVQGVAGFEGRATFKTWIFRILVIQAQRLAAREIRVLPLTDVLAGGPDGADPYAQERLLAYARDRWPGHWSAPLLSWAAPPDDAALAAELMTCLVALIDGLPVRQRAVVRLRDVEGRTSEEICARLGLQPTNQRVLLHRARLAVRAGLDPYLTEAV